jgi:hypothetical protein
MPTKPKRTLGGEVTKLGVRFIESIIVIAVLSGVRVVDYFLTNPWTWLQMTWTDLLRTGNMILVFLVLILLYMTDLDKKILDWLLKS